MKTNESTQSTELTNKVPFTFAPASMKLTHYMDGELCNLLNIFYNKSTMNNNENKFYIPISCLCKQLDKSNQTVQKLINQLIILKFITKVSGFRNRVNNIYSVNQNKIVEFNEMEVKDIYILREEAKKLLKTTIIVRKEKEVQNELQEQTPIEQSKALNEQLPTIKKKVKQEAPEEAPETIKELIPTIQPENNKINTLIQLNKEMKEFEEEIKQLPTTFEYDDTIERIENFKDYLSIKDIPVEMIELFNKTKQGIKVNDEMFNQFKAPYEIVREMFIKEFPKEIYN